MTRSGVSFAQQPFGSGNEVIDGILLIATFSSLMPGVTEFCPAANIRNGVDASLLNKKTSKCRELWCLAAAESTVSRQECRKIAGTGAFREYQGDRHVRTVP